MHCLMEAPRTLPWRRTGYPCAGRRRRAHAAAAAAGEDGGQRYLLTLDLGREFGTWMDPRWGNSGLRLGLSVAVELQRSGQLVPLATSPYCDLGLKAGKDTWSHGLSDNTLRLTLTLGKRLQRGDVYLDEGTKLYLALGAWRAPQEGGGASAQAETLRLSKQRGTVCVRQRRMLVRLEQRLVGRFTAAEVEADEALLLPPLTMRQGSADGPIFK